MSKVLFQEEKQHISENLTQSNNCGLYSLESKDLVPIKLLHAACYYFPLYEHSRI